MFNEVRVNSIHYEPLRTYVIQFYFETELYFEKAIYFFPQILNIPAV